MARSAVKNGKANGAPAPAAERACVVCGARLFDAGPFCPADLQKWMRSPEFRRAEATENESAQRCAIDDFVRMARCVR